VIRSILFNRMPRIQEPLPDEEVKIPGPPNVQPPQKVNWLQIFLPIAGILVMVGVYGGARGDWMLAIPMVAMSGFSIVGSLVARETQRKEQQKKLEESQTAYTEALRVKREQLEVLRRTQQRISHNAYPDLNAIALWAQQRDPHLWGRRPTDADFLHARVGVGTAPSSVIVSAPDPAMPDPTLKEALAIKEEYSWVPSVPIAVDLCAGPLTIVGAGSSRRKAARALLLHLIAHHAPSEVYLAAVYTPGHDPAWDWLRWLPHTYVLDSKSPFLSRNAKDNASACSIANDSDSASETLDLLLEEFHRRQNLRQNQQQQHTSDNDFPEPWIVVLVEDLATVRDAPAIHLLLSPEGRALNITAIFLADKDAQVPQNSQAILHCYPDNTFDLVRTAPGSMQLRGASDLAPRDMAENVARCLAPLREYAFLSDDTMPTSVRLLDSFDIEDVGTKDWDRHEGSKDFLQVPIGDRRGNQPLILDLNHTGHGPHGLLAGTTGSGKSELLQTLVVSLAIKHHPHDLGFVMVDFKGGGTFQVLQHLPHTLGMVTDLSGALAMRALVALEAEVDRRKTLFNQAGVNDIGPYQRAYWDTQKGNYVKIPVTEPLPHLVIIVDEFAELVSDYPEFMSGLIGIARVGRSLGLHLILATQSPGGVVNQQIWANAKFRICLRVESRQESMDMLHRAEAANLPRMPGRGYLQVGNNDVFELFQVARVAGTYYDKKSIEAASQQRRVFVADISRLGVRKKLFDSKDLEEKPDPAKQQTDMDVVVDRLKAVAQQLDIKRLPSPWPDPLPTQLSLLDLMIQERYASWVPLPPPPSPIMPEPPKCRKCHEILRENAKFCLKCGTPVTELWLTSLLGLADDPAHQRQGALEIPLAEQDGHLLMIGAPGSGVDMLVRTLIFSLALTYTPDRLNFYLLEFGGGLQIFESLPHVGNLSRPGGESERVQRLLRFLLDELEERAQRWNKEGVESLTEFHDKAPDLAPPAIVVVLTGFAEFRANFPDETAQLGRLLREGGRHGIHLILTGDRPGDIPSAINSLVARRIALALADPNDYSVVLGTTLRVAKNQTLEYGRGWYGRPPLQFQTAMPGREAGEAELQSIIQAMAESWQGRRPKAIEVLPDVLPLEERVLAQVGYVFPPQPPAHTAVPIGVEGLRMRPLWVGLDADGPDFIITGSAQSGKTTLLLTWALTLAKYNTPEWLQFILVSGRRNSLDALKDLPHILEYCNRPEVFKTNEVFKRLSAEIDRRDQMLNTQQVTLAELSHIMVMIDDYDDFANTFGTTASGGSPDREIVPELERLIKQGRDINIHTVIAGPTNLTMDASRDPIVKQTRLGRSGFVLRLLDTNESTFMLKLRPADIAQMSAGRGYIVRNGVQEFLQIGMPGTPEQVAAWVEKLRTHWSEESVQAAWPSEVLQKLAEKALEAQTTEAK